MLINAKTTQKLIDNIKRIECGHVFNYEVFSAQKRIDF